MKYRQTFVANSSSASYMIVIPITLDHLLNICDEYTIGFDKKSIEYDNT